MWETEKRPESSEIQSKAVYTDTEGAIQSVCINGVSVLSGCP